MSTDLGYITYNGRLCSLYGIYIPENQEIRYDIITEGDPESGKSFKVPVAKNFFVLVDKEFGGSLSQAMLAKWSQSNQQTQTPQRPPLTTFYGSEEEEEDEPPLIRRNQPPSYSGRMETTTTPQRPPLTTFYGTPSTTLGTEQTEYVGSQVPDPFEKTEEYELPSGIPGVSPIPIHKAVKHAAKTTAQMLNNEGLDNLVFEGDKFIPARMAKGDSTIGANITVETNRSLETSPSLIGRDPTLSPQDDLVRLVGQVGHLQPFTGMMTPVQKYHFTYSLEKMMKEGINSKHVDNMIEMMEDHYLARPIKHPTISQSGYWQELNRDHSTKRRGQEQSFA